MWGSISAVHRPGSHAIRKRWIFLCSLLGSPEILWSAGSYKGHISKKQWWTEIVANWCYIEIMKCAYTCIGRCVYVNRYLNRRNESSCVAWQEQAKDSTPTQWSEWKEWSSPCASSVRWTAQGWLHGDEEVTGCWKDRNSPLLSLCREGWSVQSAIRFLVKKNNHCCQAVCWDQSERGQSSMTFRQRVLLSLQFLWLLLLLSCFASFSLWEHPLPWLAVAAVWWMKSRIRPRQMAVDGVGIGAGQSPRRTCF